MKKTFLSVVCFILAALFLCSCADKKTELFGSRGASPYVKAGDADAIKIDRDASDYKEYFDALYLSDVTNAELFDRVDEGAVQSGDYANIDFIGTINDIAFDGGTSTGYDLLIGSKSFIDGFEDGLIGVNVGETVKLDLTFPEDYDSEDLAGKAVVFTVTVNYRKVARPMEKAYGELGYESLESYKADLESECDKYFAVKKYVESCTFKEIPEKDEFTGLVMLVFYDNYLRQAQKMDLPTYLKNTSQTMDGFITDVVKRVSKDQLQTVGELKSVQDTVLAFYALFYKEDMTVDKEALGKTTGYQRLFDEFTQVKKAAVDFICEKVIDGYKAETETKEK